MKTQKVFKIIAYISIGLSILVIIGLTLFQQWQIKKFKQGIDSGIKTSTDTSDKAIEAGQQPADQTTTGSIPDTKEIDNLNAMLDDAEKKLDDAYERYSQETEKARLQREFYKKMIEDPSFKSGIRASMKNTNETLYGPLFKDLGLSQDRLDNFKDLLADYRTDVIVISQGTLIVSTETEKADLQRQYDDNEDSYKTRFKEVLGTKDYATYQSYQDRLNERYVVNLFVESLGQDEKLSEEQQHVLVEALYNEREAVYSQMDYDPKKLEPIIFMNDDTIARRMKATGEIYSRALEDTRSALSATQHERLKDYLRQQRETEEESLRLAVQEFGGVTAQKTTDKSSQ